MTTKLFLESYSIVGLAVGLILHLCMISKWSACGWDFLWASSKAVALVILTLMTNWQKQAENALDRVTYLHLHLQWFLSNRIRVRKIEIPPFLYFIDHEIISSVAAGNTVPLGFRPLFSDELHSHTLAAADFSVNF